jgi:hypothetical protein
MGLCSWCMGRAASLSSMHGARIGVPAAGGPEPRGRQLPGVWPVLGLQARVSGLLVPKRWYPSGEPISCSFAPPSANRPGLGCFLIA